MNFNKIQNLNQSPYQRLVTITKCRWMHLLLFYTVLAALLNYVAAWWDQGHLLIAAVARLQLSEKDVTVLERPLTVLDKEYPGLNSLITAAVWPDHIKCRSSSVFCRGTPFLDGLEIFNSWHYVSQIYNPQKLSLPALVRSLPFPGTGTPWALCSLLGYEITEFLHAINETHLWNYMDDPNAHAPCVRANRHNDFYTEASSHEFLNRLGPFAWNIRLRFLIHLLGDLHQPLHTAETFSLLFPNGDSGGANVPVNISVKNVQTLHHLWDSCGTLYTEAWPDYNETEALKQAAELISAFPEQVIYPKSATSFWSVARESYKIVEDYVYREFNFTKINATQMQLPYTPSGEYLTLTQQICRRQIVLGGYRLAMVLTDLAKLLRHANWGNKKLDTFVVKTGKYDHHQNFLMTWFLASLSTALLFVLSWHCLSICRKRYIMGREFQLPLLISR